MKIPFFLILIFLFGCIQNFETENVIHKSIETVPEMLLHNNSIICNVALNDEKGIYEGKLRINNGNYKFEFRLKGISSELIKIDEMYYQKINESWIGFCVDSFKLAEMAGATDPNIVLNLRKTSLSCWDGKVELAPPENYTNYTEIMNEMIANETKVIESLGIKCELFLFYGCEEFEGKIKEACEYCKK